MGILDDAIREHLDLKRRLGAADDELKQLEDEAFGPPARPGDPDFPTSESPVQEESQGSAPEGEAIEEAPVAAEPAPVAVEEQIPASPEAEAPSEELEAESSSEELEAEAPSEELEAERPEPVAAEPEPPAVHDDTSEPEAPTQIFDQSIEQDLDLDLDLEDEELPDLGAEPPVESMETVEHPMEEELGEPPAPAQPQAPAEPHTAEEELGEGEPDSEEDEEDVLADTPEFLRDQPEDDELWFEQGEPKDFDFD